jgi:hypothetical protein
MTFEKSIERRFERKNISEIIKPYYYLDNGTELNGGILVGIGDCSQQFCGKVQRWNLNESLIFI